MVIWGGEMVKDSQGGGVAAHELSEGVGRFVDERPGRNHRRVLMLQPGFGKVHELPIAQLARPDGVGRLEGGGLDRVSRQGSHERRYVPDLDQDNVFSRLESPLFQGKIGENY